MSRDPATYPLTDEHYRDGAQCDRSEGRSIAEKHYLVSLPETSGTRKSCAESLHPEW